MRSAICSVIMLWAVASYGHDAGFSLSLGFLTPLAHIDTLALKRIESWITEGSYEKAIGLCRKELGKNHTNSVHKLKIHILLITALNQNEQYEQALRESESLYTLNPKSLQKDKILQRAFFFQRAYTYSGLHNQKHEIAYTQKALMVMEANPALFSVADFISTYNDLYYYQLNYEDRNGLEATYGKYQVFFNRKRNELKKDDHAHARRVLRKMEVTMALYQERPDQAIGILKVFLGEVERPFNDSDIAYLNSCFSHINNYYYFVADYRRAIAFAGKYLSFAKQTASSFGVMLAYSKMGASYEQLGDYEQGIRCIDLSLNAFKFGTFSASKYALMMIKAKCLSGKKRYSEACQLAESAIEEILTYKFKKPSKISDFEITGITNLNSHNYINIFATAGLLFLDRHRQSHQATDMDKAEKLLKTSSAMFREFYLKGEYNPTLYKLHLKNTEGLLYVASKKYPNDPKPLTSILDMIEENASQHLYKSYLRKTTTPEKDRLNLGKENLGRLIDATQQQLEKGEQLLRYYVLPKDIYVVQMSHNTVQLHRMASTSNVKEASARFVEGLGQLRDGYKKDGEFLARHLLPKGLGGRLTIIPDNFLNYLPFEALRIPASEKFLIQQHEVSYAYSLAILNWNLSVQLQKDGKKTLILNPLYGEGASYLGFLLPPLPFSHTEANEIARLMGGTVIGGKVGKTDFIKQSSNYPIYHFAMHAYLDQENFNRSCLLFSKGEPLFFEELYQRRIPAELIVLGACNTGNGKLRNGEGIMSLATAFSFAGTRSSIFSLWKVPDKETAQVLGAFYAHLKNGLGKDEALALAKRDFIRKNPMKSHPFFWAGFIVNGDTAALFTKPMPNWLMVVAGLLILLALFIFFRKRLSA